MRRYLEKRDLRNEAQRTREAVLKYESLCSVDLIAGVRILRTGGRMQVPS